MPPVYFPHGFRLGAADYIPMLKNKVVPWVEMLKVKYPGRQIIWQQDNAPAHTAASIQTFLAEYFGKDNCTLKNIWPPNSPDVNPMDFSIWAMERPRHVLRGI